MLRKVLNPTLGLIVLALSISIWVQRDALSQFMRSGDPVGEPLTVGTNVWPGYEPLYLARSLGLYEDRIRLVEYSSATEVIRALRNKLIDVGALTLDEVLLLRQRGVDVRIVLVTDISDGGDGILARPDLTTLTDLKGRRVGVESTALGAYVLTRALQTVGLTPADGHHAAYTRGQVDAVVTFEPARSRILKDGARQLFDSSQMPGEIVDVIAIRADALPEKATRMQLLVDGWFKALAYISEDPEDSGKRIAGRLNLLPEEALASFDGLMQPDSEACLAMFDDRHASSIRRTADRLAAAMKSEKLLEGDVDLASLVIPKFVQALRR